VFSKPDDKSLRHDMILSQFLTSLPSFETHLLQTYNQKGSHGLCWISPRLIFTNPKPGKCCSDAAPLHSEFARAHMESDAALLWRTGSAPQDWVQICNQLRYSIHQSLLGTSLSVRSLATSATPLYCGRICTLHRTCILLQTCTSLPF